MSQIDREGTFRGHALELAVNTTKNGFPQLVIKFAADELHDEETREWEPWAEYEQEIIGYFVLFGAKGKCLNFEQVQKAFGWDGVSFAGLDQLEGLDNIVLQLRVEWDEYDGVKNLKAVWIDAADAVPGGAGLRKIDTTVLKAMDVQYAGQMGTKKITPKKAPKGKPTAPPKKGKPKPKVEEPTPEPDLVDDSPIATSPPAPRARRSKKKETGSGLPDSCTREEAWGKVCELKMASVTDDQLSEAWVATVDTIAGEDTDPNDVTPEQWAEIRNNVLDAIPSIPF